MLSDYKTDLTFLQAELTERFDGSNARESSEQPILNLAGLDVEMTNEGAVNSTTGAEDVKQLGTMSRSVSMRSRAGHSLSRIQEVSQLQLKYEGEVEDLRRQIAELESKNKKYLEVIGMTASEQQENMKLQMEAAQEALTFTKRAKADGLGENGVLILDELEEMLEAQQQEMLGYQEQINLLNQELDAQKKTAEERSVVNHRCFDEIKRLETEKAKADDQIEEMKGRLLEVTAENTSLHQVQQETDTVREERVQLASNLAQLQTELESLRMENEYYKTNMVPELRGRLQDIKKKQKESDARMEALEQQKQALAGENESMRRGNRDDNEQIDRLRQASAEAAAKNEALEAQMSTLRARFDEQLQKQADSETALRHYAEQVQAYEQKVDSLQDEKAEAESLVQVMQGDLEDLKKSNESFESENKALLEARNVGRQTI